MVIRSEHHDVDIEATIKGDIINDLRKQTNADRLAKGLGPLPPTRRLSGTLGTYLESRELTDRLETSTVGKPGDCFYRRFRGCIRRVSWISLGDWSIGRLTVDPR